MAVKCTTITTSVLTALAHLASGMLKISTLNNYNSSSNIKQDICEVLSLDECNSNSSNSSVGYTSYNTKIDSNSNSNTSNNNSSDNSIIISINCDSSNSSSSSSSIIINSNIKQTHYKDIKSNTYSFTNSVSHCNNSTINANDNINEINCYYNGISNNNNNNCKNNNDNNNNNSISNTNSNRLRQLYDNNNNNDEHLNVKFVNIDDNTSTITIHLNTMDFLATTDHAAASFSPSSSSSSLTTTTATTTTTSIPSFLSYLISSTTTASTVSINKSNYNIKIDIQLLNDEYDLATTITAYNNETTWMHPSETDIILGIFLSVLIFLSIAGNVLVCVAIYTERSLRRIGNLFLASLAIADLFVASLVMTFAGINDLLGYWIFGADFCDTWVAFDVMCSTASILNLCAISLDRYIHIKDPLRYGRWVTRRVAIITIASIWLLAAFVSFVPISMGLHRPDQPLIVEDNGKRYPTCALDLTPTYAIVSSSISFYFPCVVMIAIYCRLYCYAQKHVKSIKAVTRPGEIAEKQRYKSIRRSKAQQQSQQQHQQKKFKMRNLHSSPYHVSDHKAAITVGVIMGVFLICWVPFFCVNIVAAFCKTCIGGQTFKILSWLGYSNSAFNPIIYSIFNKEFRDAFKRILTTRIPCYCGKDTVNIHSRNSDRYVTDYTTKQHVVAINSGHSSAEIEQVSAI